MRWFVSPDLSAGTRIQLSTVIGAEMLTPKVLDLLSRAMQSLKEQPASPHQVDSGICPELQQCANNTAQCPRLEYCGVHRPD
jgi:hypothetical protein